MTFFLDRAAEFKQLRGDRLIGGFENVYQGTREAFIVFGEESDGESGRAGTTRSKIVKSFPPNNAHRESYFLL